MIRNLLTLSVFVMLSCQLPFAGADRKADFQEAYQSYQRAMGIGDTVAAMKAAEKAYKLGSKLYGKKSVNAAKLAINYAGLLSDSREHKKAKRVLKGKLAVMEERYDEHAVDLIAPLMELAKAEFNPKKPQKSLAYFERVASIVSKQDNAVFLASKHEEIANTLIRIGGRQHTRPYFEAAHHGYASVLQPEDTRLGKSLMQMGLIALQDNNFKAATEYLNDALTSFDRGGSMNASERTVRELLISVLSHENRHEEATAHVQALGEFTEGPPSPVYTVPLDLEPKQVRKMRGNAIVVGFKVDSQGFVSSPHILNSSVEGLNAAALAAISQFRFAPRFVGGKPVATTNVDYTFDFREQSSIEQAKEWGSLMHRATSCCGGSRQIYPRM